MIKHAPHNPILLPENHPQHLPHIIGAIPYHQVAVRQLRQHPVVLVLAVQRAKTEVQQLHLWTLRVCE